MAHVHSVPGKPHLEEVELADGRVYQLQRARNKTGYFCVVEGRPNEYHAKPKVNGIGQVTLPGGACKTTRAATLRLAIYLADPYALDVKKPAAGIDYRQGNYGGASRGCHLSAV